MFSGLCNLLPFFTFALAYVWEIRFCSLFPILVGSESYREASQLKRILEQCRHSKVASVLTENTYTKLNGPFPVSDHAQTEIRDFSICLYIYRHQEKEIMNKRTFNIFKL